MGVKTTIISTFVAVTVCHVPLSDQLVQVCHAGQNRTFTGSWVANGSKEVLNLGAGRESALFRLSGHVSLKEDIGAGKEFWAQCIGLADSSTGSNLRCVWRGMDGQELYLELKGSWMEKGSRVSGNIIGGSRQANGITGTLQFTWLSMSFSQTSDDTSISGYSQDVSGSYQIP